MKIRILKTYNVLITWLISLLGFSSACKEIGDDEYGAPSAKFIVNGKVTSSETNQAIEGVQVCIRNKWNSNNVNTVYTDFNGKYQMIDENTQATSQIYIIDFKDVDGELNGDFSDLKDTVEFINPEFKNGNGWYEGETTKEHNVKLTPKNVGE